MKPHRLLVGMILLLFKGEISCLSANSEGEISCIPDGYDEPCGIQKQATQCLIYPSLEDKCTSRFCWTTKKTCYIVGKTCTPTYCQNSPRHEPLSKDKQDNQSLNNKDNLDLQNATVIGVTGLGCLVIIMVIALLIRWRKKTRQRILTSMEKSAESQYSGPPPYSIAIQMNTQNIESHGQLPSYSELYDT